MCRMMMVWWMTFKRCMGWIYPMDVIGRFSWIIC